MTLTRFFNALLDFVATPRPTDVVIRSLTLADLRRLTLRGNKSGSLPYHDPQVTALVWELKYYANKKAAMFGGSILSDVLISVASESLGTPLLIPVPMHAKRKRERGHNQTEVLCKAALTHAQSFVEYNPHALVRVKATPPQQSLHKYERVNNLKDSMRVKHPKDVKGRVCIVVDDVSTTGATFAEATRALQAAGAARVECVALAYS